MNQPRPKDTMKLVITGGGTGGHVYPGIAVAKEFQKQFPETLIAFIGTRTGLEAKILPYEGFALETIHMQGFIGKGIAHKLKTLYLFPYAVYRAIHHLRKFRPQLVFGTGGYVSVPVIYAAYLLHLPTMILEPNRQPGLANRLLAKSVNKVAICFEDTAAFFPRKKVVLTGNPIRKEFSLIGQIPPPDKGTKLNILIIGGSSGATRINHAVIDALDNLSALRDQLVFTHQTGKRDFFHIKTRYDQKGFQADVLEYIDDIPRMYARSHLIICRAGANTVAELTASRRLAILIPYPHADRHQEFNARALEEAGTGKVIVQQHLSGKTLADAIIHCLQHPDEFGQVWETPLCSETGTAAEKIVDICVQLVNTRMTA